MHPPSSDSTKIFDFIDEVRSNAINNAIVPFRDFNDMEAYLRQQWAGMMFSFLTQDNENKRMADTLSMLGDVNARIEMISRQILKSVGTEDAKITADLYDVMLKHECVRDMSYWNLKPTPAAILEHSSFDSCTKSIGGEIQISYTGNTIGPNLSMSRVRLALDKKDYVELRKELIEILKAHDVTVGRYLSQVKAA